MTPLTPIRVLSLALSVAVLSACGGGDTDPSGQTGGPTPMVDANGVSTFDSSRLGTALAALPLETLSPAETDSLIFMREEEKLAGDVYTRMNAVWGGQVKTFANIAISEDNHTESVRQLLLRYRLSDPTLGLGEGVFQNPDLQALHDQLVSDGSTSLIAALQVGVRIEELDMLDITTHLSNVDNQDIRLVYDDLLKGSRNHLRSYYKTLLKQGGSYTPQHLDQASFDAIVNSDMEQG